MKKLIFILFVLLFSNSFGQNFFWSHSLAVNIITSDITSITGTTATGGGNIISDGGTSIIARGSCWATTINPTISSSHTTDGGGSGSFTSSLTGLSSATNYYVRAYATNSLGTIYGNNVNFTTSTIYAPTVTTNSISSITTSSASGGGNVTSDGGASVTARGVCWGATTDPTTANSHTTDGTGTGSFTSSITGLASNSGYHVRAYATNSVGTSYGSDVYFTTNNVPSGVVSFTNNNSDITSTSPLVAYKQLIVTGLGGGESISIQLTSWPAISSGSTVKIWANTTLIGSFTSNPGYDYPLTQFTYNYGDNVTIKVEMIVPSGVYNYNMVKINSGTNYVNTTPNTWQQQIQW